MEAKDVVSKQINKQHLKRSYRQKLAAVPQPSSLPGFLRIAPPAQIILLDRRSATQPNTWAKSKQQNIFLVAVEIEQSPGCWVNMRRAARRLFIIWSCPALQDQCSMRGEGKLLEKALRETSLDALAEALTEQIYSAA